MSMAAPRKVKVRNDPAAERLPNGMRVAKMPNLDWYIEHFDELYSNYPDLWLAISNRSVLASAATPEALTKILHSEHAGVPALIVGCSVDPVTSSK